MKSTSDEQLRFQCLQFAQQSEPMADGDRILELAAEFYAFIKAEKAAATDSEPTALTSPKKVNQ